MASTQISEAYEGENTKHGAVGHLSADEELQQAVCEALIADAELDSTGIGVRVAGDTVVSRAASRASKPGSGRSPSHALSEASVACRQTSFASPPRRDERALEVRGANAEMWRLSTQPLPQPFGEND